MTELLPYGICLQLGTLLLTLIILSVTGSLFLQGFMYDSRTIKYDALQMVVPSLIGLAMANMHTFLAYGPSKIGINALNPTTLLYANAILLVSTVLIAPIIVLFTSKGL